MKPGGLSVSRTFGDIEAKVPELGGTPGVIVSEPEIQSITYTPDLDWVLLACDGVFDSLTNEEVNAIIWETLDYWKESKNLCKENFNDFLSDCVNNVLKKSLINNSEDNVTLIIVFFKDLQQLLERYN